MAAGLGIVGRDAELAAVERLLSDARNRFAALLLEGEAGIGKTTVLRKAMRVGEASGFEVLECRPGASDASLSMAAVGDLLQGVPVGRWEGLPTPQRRALEVALLLAEPGEKPADQRAVAAGVRSLLCGLAVERPVLVAVDDVQWLDPASAAVFAFVFRRLGPERVGVVATRRLAETAALDLPAVVPRDALTRQRIGPLSLGALQRLLGERVGRGLTRATLSRVHATSGGNPLFALEISRVLADRGPVPAGEPLPVPDDVRKLVRSRVESLPTATRELLLAAALLADPTHATLGAVVGRSPDADLDPAELAGIATFDRDVLVFAHPLHAAAVVASATVAERREMHRRLSTAVAEPEERARHLAFGTAGPDAAVAKQVEDGAALARIRGGLHAAAELLERARELTPLADGEAARSRGLRAAELWLHVRDRDRTRTILEELLAEPLVAAQRAEALRLLAELSFSEEDVEATSRLLTEAVSLAESPTAAARIQLDLVYVTAQQHDFVTASEIGHRALENLAGSSDGPLLAEALVYSAMADFLAGRGVDWDRIDRGLALEDPERISLMGLRPRAVAALLLLYVDRHGEARERLEAVCSFLAERGDERDLAHLLLWLCWLETKCARFARADDLADEALRYAEISGNDYVRRWGLLQRAYVHAHRGELAEARRISDEAALGYTASSTGVSPWIYGTRALIALSAGDPEAVWDACRVPIEMIEKFGLVEPGPAFFLPDAIEALIALGRLDRAEALLDVFEGRGRDLDRVWALATGGRCRGLLLAAKGDLAAAAAALERTLVEHERIELPFDRARTLLAKGVTERRMRKRRAARASLEEAVHEFERMGAQLWAERARSELARVGGRKPGAEGELTPTERRIAELAAQGLANKEIAATLFVSVHTVEVHLSHAYAKLGIRSRSQLAARLGAET